MLIPALRRLGLVVQAPPPWFWLGKGWIFRRCRPAPLSLLPLELLQQLHWWLIRPLRLPHRRPKDLPLPPWQLTLRACWLNSYRPIEVAWWWALGIRSWNQLIEQTPDSLAGAMHAKRRRHWPDQCRPALHLLADKAALLACTPECWRSPFLVLPYPESAHQPSCNWEGLKEREIPAWWLEALAGEGVVLKPQLGHAGRGVIRFRWSGTSLQQQALFWRLPCDAPHANNAVAPNPKQLLAHWHRLCRCQEPALAAPYLHHSSELPATTPSVVVRVITRRQSPEGPAAMQQAWLEVPLDDSVVVFLSPDGVSLPALVRPLTPGQQNSLDQWKQLLHNGAATSVQACMDAAVRMHEHLPAIDQVAWDWIPASPQPLLLEGNGGFGLLVPQLFAYRQSVAAQPVRP